MPTQTAAPLPLTAPRRWNRPRLQELGLIVVIILIGAALASLAEPVHGENGFLRPGNLIPSVFTTMSWIAIMAVGMTVVIITGGIDISVGSITGLAALATAAVLQRLPDEASALKVLPIAFAVALGVGLICGFVNGALVVGLRMHPFIVTLATMSIFRGVGVVNVPEGSLPFGDKLLPAAFTDNFVARAFQFVRANGRHESVQPVPMIAMLVTMLLGWLYLRWLVWGRETYAIGGNEEAARFSGIAVGWVKMRAYLISGLCAGLAGLISCGYYKSAATNTGTGYELTVIAAAVVGGASLSGGRGTALGALLGALVIQLIDDGISILRNVNFGLFTVKVSKEYTQIIVGIAIVLAVGVDQISQHLQSRRLRQRGGK